jgi:hypothetical protein
MYTSHYDEDIWWLHRSSVRLIKIWQRIKWAELQARPNAIYELGRNKDIIKKLLYVLRTLWKYKGIQKEQCVTWRAAKHQVERYGDIDLSFRMITIWNKTVWEMSSPRVLIFSSTCMITNQKKWTLVL